MAKIFLDRKNILFVGYMQQGANLMSQSYREILALMDNTESQVYMNQWIVFASNNARSRVVHIITDYFKEFAWE